MFKIYWTENNKPNSKDFESLSEALKYSECLRKADHKFVTMVSENPNCTSLTGVDSVKSGILPNGAEYGYVKRRYK